jgi:hypothetical protein
MRSAFSPVTLAFLLAAWCGAGVASGQHFHLHAGALAQTQGSQLYFWNGAGFVTNSQFCQPLRFTNSGVFAGYHEGSLTFASLPGTPATAGPHPSAALPGAQILLRFVSCEGPTGGSFGVWNVDGFNFDENEAETLTFSLPVGTTNGSNTIILGENLGEPGADPFGHIHGRHYSATLPGLYTLGLQLVDVSANGPGGTPVHQPSDLFRIYFQAGFTNPPFVLQSNRLEFTFGSMPGQTYLLEATTNLSVPTVWTNLDTVAGANSLRVLADDDATGPKKFYRVRMTTP